MATIDAITVARRASHGESLFTIKPNDEIATKTINESLEIIRSHSDSNYKLTFALCGLEIEKGKQCRMQLARLSYSPIVGQDLA